ncbi:unnamed protein product [Caenorhabditis brenneri]
MTQKQTEYSQAMEINGKYHMENNTDCPICYETRQPEEQILGCNGSPYIFHLSCLRKWFEDKKGCTKCPQCQKTLRDPDHNPTLQ